MPEMISNDKGSVKVLAIITIFVIAIATVVAGIAWSYATQETDENEIICPLCGSPYIWTPIGTFSENFNWKCLECGHSWMETFPEKIYQEWREALLDPEYVRDYTIFYLKEITGEDLPNPLTTTWTGSRETPEGLIGSETYIYRAEAINVTITYPIVLPENTIYKISVEHQGTNVWEGQLQQRQFIPSTIKPVSQEESLKIAYTFLMNSPTFQFDGIKETVKHTSTYTARCPYCWTFVFTFECRHAGYGDRTGQILAQVITPHTAHITIQEGIVVSAVIDEKWDIIKQRMLSTQSNLKTFTSKENLEAFISEAINKAEAEQRLQELLGYVIYKDMFTTSVVPALSVESMESNGPQHSTTNMQVAGVDEADCVKTDGKNIYIATENRFLIVEAYQPEKMKLISTTNVEGRISGLFINDDRLVVFEESQYQYPKPSTAPYERDIIPSLYGVHIKVYDISNREKPQLVRDVFLKGSYLNSRMIGDWVYVAVSQPAVYCIQDKHETTLPQMYIDGEEKEIPATRIHYAESSDIPVNYTLIVAMNVHGMAEEEPECEVILTGYATCMYVSQRNIYVVMPSGGWWKNGEDITVIHRITVNGPHITCQASGEVPGRVLNQFSMDEYEGHFRIATTKGHVARNQASSSNNLYILDEGLNTVGSLEDLAPGEQIHSARFIGERCYLVTFKKVDPLFTIDVSSPEEPKVLGKLKIPGYSDYLHPYDGSHLIGIGKETVEAEEGDFAWYQGLKISLFDVSDVERPIEAGKLVIGDRGTESPVLRDHHALLLDKRSNLLVIPVLEAQIIPEKYPEEVHPSTQGEYIFQGVYVLHVDSEEGISVKGKITHIEDPQAYLKSGYYFQSLYEIKRSLYIDDILYTISDGKIKANSLTDLTEISTIKLL